MAANYLSVVFTLIAFTMIASLSGYSSVVPIGGRRALLSEWQFVGADPNDPSVIKIAEFALGGYKKEHLYFEHVVEAVYEKVSSETTYRLIIAARGQWGVENYNAEVLVQGDAMKLVVIKEN